MTALTLLVVAGAMRTTSAVGDRLWGRDYFPNVELITHTGKTVRFYDDLLKGKSVVINVIYTRCKDRCPLETAKLSRVQRLLSDRMGKDIFFYSISLDPEWDTPAVLRDYAEKFRVGPGWLFLTGKREDIAGVQKKLGLYSRTDAVNPDGHLPSAMIGNEPTGQWMLNSAVDNPRFLAATITNFLIGWKNRQVVTAKSYESARPIPGFDAGSYLFETKCAACHTFGEGDGIGPDLAGVTRARDRAWLEGFIKAPDRMLAQNDPIATALFAKYKQVVMPNLRLGDGDVAALVKYIEAHSAAANKKTR
ncbi:MAG TPA: SCO family protein [Thermoanaerobaculia bacterium]